MEVIQQVIGVESFSAWSIAQLLQKILFSVFESGVHFHANILRLRDAVAQQESYLSAITYALSFSFLTRF